MEQPADESAERGEDAFALSAGKAARQNIEDTGAGCNGKKKGGRKEKQKSMRVKHSKILETPRIACKTQEWETVDYKLGFDL